MTAVTELMQRDATKYGITYTGAAAPPAVTYPPSLHAATHLPGGSDEITGLAVGSPAATAVTFDHSGLIVITGATNVETAIQAVDAAIVADRARLTTLEGKTALVMKATDGNAGAAVNNSNTLINDPELVLPVVVSAVYLVRARIRYDAASTADVKIGWTGPTGATMNWTPDSYISTVATAASSSSILRQSFVIGNSVALGGVNAGTVLVANVVGVLRTDGTHAGTLQFKWAQNVAEVSDVFVRADSTLELYRYS